MSAIAYSVQSGAMYARGYGPSQNHPRDVYFCDRQSTRYSYYAIAEKVKGTRVEGKHIFDQLKFLGLVEVFETGWTPFSLPYSFSNVEK